MKARLPKSYMNLPQSEKDAIQQLYQENLEREVNRYFAKLQKNWLMMSCIVMADFMGKSADECLLYLANFKEVYRINSKIKGDEEQQAWLSGKMEEIFGVGGYPTQYIDKLEEM